MCVSGDPHGCRTAYLACGQQQQQTPSLGSSALALIRWPSVDIDEEKSNIFFLSSLQRPAYHHLLYPSCAMRGEGSGPRDNEKRENERGGERSRFIWPPLGQYILLSVLLYFFSLSRLPVFSKGPPSSNYMRACVSLSLFC